MKRAGNQELKVYFLHNIFINLPFLIKFPFILRSQKRKT
jgi:hypothetical protein